MAENTREGSATTLGRELPVTGDLYPVTVPRILLAGTHQGVGVSTIVLGLLVALRKAGLVVSTAHVETSLLNATHHRRVSQRLAHSLDTWMLSREQFMGSFARACAGAELLVLEGEGGLFDKRPKGNCFESLADIAVTLRTPLVLVVDARGVMESVGAVVAGFHRFRAGVEVSAVIANHIRDHAQDACFREAIERSLGIPYLGGVREGAPRVISEGSGEPEGLNPSLISRGSVFALGERIESAIDLRRFREIAELAGVVSVDAALITGSERRCRIAVADDIAFHLTIQDNLDLLRRAGAELVGFSPLVDRKLPGNIVGVYLPGGYVHLYAADLHVNRDMHSALRNFVRAGGALYAEAGAVAYLSETVRLMNGDSYGMCGIIPGEATAVIENRVQPPAVRCEALAVRDNLICSMGESIRGLSDPRWIVKSTGDVPRSFELIERGRSGDGGGRLHRPLLGGMSPLPNILANSFYTHWGSCPGRAERFLAEALRCRDDRAVQSGQRGGGAPVPPPNGGGGVL